MARPSRDNEILAAALAVFAVRGYDATRVRQIAERAGVSEAALYSHHESKEAVAIALFRRHTGRYAETLRVVATDQRLGVEERIRRIAWRTLQAFADEPDAIAFVITHQARFITAVPEDFPLPIRILEQLVREGQLEGTVRPGPAHVIAAVVLGCLTQPIRAALEAPESGADLLQQAARALIADAAWSAVAQR